MKKLSCTKIAIYFHPKVIKGTTNYIVIAFTLYALLPYLLRFLLPTFGSFHFNRKSVIFAVIRRDKQKQVCRPSNHPFGFCNPCLRKRGLVAVGNCDKVSCIFWELIAKNHPTHTCCIFDSSCRIRLRMDDYHYHFASPHLRTLRIVRAIEMFDEYLFAKHPHLLTAVSVCYQASPSYRH